MRASRVEVLSDYGLVITQGGVENYPGFAPHG